ncbi:MAG TPA: polymer-forming cytoskeletal protein [Gammaproteobacteria bacterium]|nr:polymer-forming cytoskeletal protein [Gammaproteobacteria bacterium]
MFELGRKDADSGHTASGQSATGQAASAAPRAASGQGAIIGRSIKINGDVKGAEDLRIEGDVSGTVELKSNSLTVGKEGKVSADIYARSITVEGTTEGDLFASERIAIRASANVRGNLLAPRVSLEEGARFKGAIEMDPQAVEKVLGPTQGQAKSGGTPDSLASKPNGNAKAASEPASVVSAGR